MSDCGIVFIGAKAVEASRDHRPKSTTDGEQFESAACVIDGETPPIA